MKYNRQEALRRLTKYNPAEVKFTLVRESDNAYDENAVAVMLSVRNSTPYKNRLYKRIYGTNCIRCTSKHV